LSKGKSEHSTSKCAFFVANFTEKMAQLRNTFRTAFNFANVDYEAWFPGHMNKGMNQMQQKLRNVDCIIEIHDARIPFSGRNPRFYDLLTVARPHILVLNKVDLTDMSPSKHIKAKLMEEGYADVMYTNATETGNRGVNKVIPTVINILKDKDRFHRNDAEDYQMMVIGIPNVGKSSIINVLRTLYLKKGNATRVGASPGVTRSVLEKIRISEEPRIYLLDTPGVLAPGIKNTEEALRLALCATVKDEMVGSDALADYLLYWMNKHKRFEYVNALEMNEPCDDIGKVLLHTALMLGKRKAVKTPEGRMFWQPDFHAAAMFMIRRFRQGKFGKFFLDTDRL